MTGFGGFLMINFYRGCTEISPKKNEVSGFWVLISLYIRLAEGKG
jgi:hypothetical protein